MTDDTDNIAATMRMLEAARTPGEAIDLSSVKLPEIDGRQAWAIHQAAVARHGPVVGWKTGAPTPEAEPGFGEIAGDSVHQSPAEIPAEALRLWAVEAEVAVTFGRDFPARDEAYSVEEVLAGVASWHAAIEVLDSAFAVEGWAEAPALWRLADRQSHGVLVLGPGTETPPPGPLDRLPVRLLIDGLAAFAHEGGNTGGDPTRLLVAVVNTRSKTSRAVKAGDVVTTGSTTPFHRAKAGQKVVAEFDGLEPAVLTIGA